MVHKRTLDVGKQADLVILSNSPLTVGPEKIHTIEVLKTYKEGKLVCTQ
ncbi:MAG: amidohydrolase family protein [Vibrionaceae bacterium]|nr:amidohydrolase family protein [Vibrionaceae bacterium]